MEVVLDTSALQQLLLKPCKAKGATYSIETSIDGFIKSRQLVLAVDASGGLIDEWRQTCGREPVQVLVALWESNGGLHAVATKDIAKLAPHIAKELRQYGFDDTIDKLVLKIALALKDKTIVADDGDFWDPRNRHARGRSTAVVARLCRQRLCVTILLLSGLMRALRMR
jgi:hypothetical protein